MSRQEIDRILNSDLSEFDHSIDNKINSIEQITGQLSEKSSFLAQFQLLLQKELGKAKKKQEEPLAQVVLFSDKIQPQQVKQQTSSFKYPQIEEQVLSSFKKQSPLKALQIESEVGDKPSLPPFAYPQIRQQPRCNHFQTKSQLNAVIIELEQFKLLINFLKEQIQAQIEYFKKVAVKHIEQSFSQIIQKERQKYEQEIRNLRDQITTLKQVNQSINNINPFADITSTKLNEISSLNITKRLKEYQTLQKLPPNLSNINSPSHQVHDIEDCKDNKLSYNQNIETCRFMAKVEKQVYTIPDIRPLTVGVPPVKNGFGVLKIGNKVIYKGMWKEGKFDGSGKLIWDDYCYQGMFSGGLFEGHGRIQFKDMNFVGKFEAGKASGDGTMQVGYNKVIGIWKANKLIRIFK